MILNCGGNIHEFNVPVIMGILNLTEDSFYDGGKFVSNKMILEYVEQMIRDGAKIIDVGALSSRPGAKLLSPKVETETLVSSIRLIKAEFSDILISVDTFRSEVLLATYDAGARMLNDISGGSWDTKLFKTVAELNIPYVLMHLSGSFSSMHKEKNYTDIVLEILEFFAIKMRVLQSNGINDVIIDPGFGFSKSLEDNYEVLKKLEVFKIFDKPLLAGISRKSMICKVLNINPEDALNGTTSLNTLALSKGVDILRVHDVKQAAEAIKLYSKYTGL